LQSSRFSVVLGHTRSLSLHKLHIVCLYKLNATLDFHIVPRTTILTWMFVHFSTHILTEVV